MNGIQRWGSEGVGRWGDKLRTLQNGGSGVRDVRDVRRMRWRCRCRCVKEREREKETERVYG